LIILNGRLEIRLAIDSIKEGFAKNGTAKSSVSQRCKTGVHMLVAKHTFNDDKAAPRKR